MTTRQDLLRRKDVPDEDVDDIIGLAAQLQDAEQAAREALEERVSVDEVRDIATELDIDPRFVEQAIERLSERREEAAAQAARDEQIATQQRARLLRLGAAALVLVLLATGGVGALGMAGQGTVRQHQRAAQQAEAKVVAALERQAALAPQIAGLAGADASSLAPLQQQAREAPDLDARLAAASELSAEMAAALGALPPASSDAEQTLRVQLTDELTGSSNRVATELGRYRTAEAAWADAAGSGTGALAVGLGMAEAP